MKKKDTTPFFNAFLLLLPFFFITHLHKVQNTARAHTHTHTHTHTHRASLSLHLMNYKDDFSLEDTRDSYRYDSDEMDSLSTSSSSRSGSSFDENVHIVGRLQRKFEKFINNVQDAYTISCRPDYRLKIKTQ